MSRTVRAALEDAPTIRPIATGTQVYDLFSEDTDLLACAVVDRGRPIGLVSRNAFFLRMADTHGRALFAKRPVTFVMNKLPLIVESDQPLNDLNRAIITERQGALFDGFIITRDGLYEGVGTGFSLMRAMQQEVEERNLKLVGLAEQLGRARIEAVSAAQAKSDFLATMSHEIRTPLNGVLGVTQLLIESGLDHERLKLAQTIQGSGEILHRLLNDVLDLSKIDAGKMELEEGAFELQTLAQDARNLWRPRADEKQIAFDVHVEDGVNAHLRGDSVRIKQILFNLIGNAIKFTSEGSIDVTLRLIAISPQRQILRAEVADTGCGIPAESQKKLFGAFTQADSATTRRFGGTGLGLTICKRLVELMGGTINFESQDGAGSRFWFELPLEKLADKPEPQIGEPPSSPIASSKAPRILVAEDNTINQEVVRGFLKLRGWDCEIVTDGEAALHAVRNDRFDLVLMDVQMPGMDGLEATRRIRKLDSKAAMTPIVALTANAMRGDEARCLEAGMNGYAAKPIVKAQLFAAIDAALAPPQPETANKHSVA
ncbi:MAG: ATP-binding protein [Pseudomonadota bacterium]